MSDLETQATAGSITMEQFGRMNVAIGEQLAGVEGELVDLSGAGDALTEATRSEDITAWWATAPLDLRREVVRYLMAARVLTPATPTRTRRRTATPSPSRSSPPTQRAGAYTHERKITSNVKPAGQDRTAMSGLVEKDPIIWRDPFRMCWIE